MAGALDAGTVGAVELGAAVATVLVATAVVATALVATAVGGGSVAAGSVCEVICSDPHAADATTTSPHNHHARFIGGSVRGGRAGVWRSVTQDTLATTAEEHHMNVGYIIGSLSAGSINRKLANALAELAAERTGLLLTEIPIGELGLYDREGDDAYPPAALAFKERIRTSDGLIICTPEYNRSIPGVLKNALDWASRPYGDNAFAGKPVGVIGASPGAIGTSLAQQHLRNILAYLDAPTLGQPEAFVQFSDDRFDGAGRVIDEDTREFLSDWLIALEAWIVQFRNANTAATGDVPAAEIDSEDQVNDPVPGAPSDNVTMSELIDALDADGFGAQFVPRDGAAVECSNCHAVVPAGELDVAVSRRLEGASDPADMSTVYAARCPQCATGGTIVLSYGINATPDEADISKALRGAA